VKLRRQANFFSRFNYTGEVFVAPFLNKRRTRKFSAFFIQSKLPNGIYNVRGCSLRNFPLYDFVFLFLKFKSTLETFRLALFTFRVFCKYDDLLIKENVSVLSVALPLHNSFHWKII
jgi:hypothetical protein